MTIFKSSIFPDSVPTDTAPEIATDNKKPVDTSPRDFLDTSRIRGDIFDKVKAAVGIAYPKSNDRYTLSLDNVRYTGPDSVDTKTQKDAILRQKNLDRPLRGTWKLTDKSTGQTVDSVDKVITRVPYMTQRGTFIVGGVEYNVSNQQRLLPGIYARRKDNGELESHVNAAPGSGPSFRMLLDPSTGVVSVKFGQSLTPVGPLLKAMGVTHEEMTNAIGPELAQINEEKGDEKTLAKLYSKMGSAKIQKQIPDPSAGMAKVVSGIKISPFTSQITLGKPHENVSKDALLGAVTKLVRINKGELEPDDRDAQYNQLIFSPDDLFAERIARDTGALGHKYLWKATNRGNLSYIPSGALTPQLYGVIYRSGTAMPLEEINPMAILDQLQKVTRLGEGGIAGGTMAIPEESHDVQPSQLALIDPISGPESEKIGVDTRLAANTFRGPNNTIVRNLIDVKTGKHVLVNNHDLANKSVVFPDELSKPGKYVNAIQNGRMVILDRNQASYAVPSYEDMFAINSNLVPLTGELKGGRLLMGSKMVTQALPLKFRESPLVRAATSAPEGDWESRVASWAGAIRSPVDGVVASVKPGEVTIKSPDGKTHAVETYDDFPFNRKTYISSIPSVKEGDLVKNGDLLAASNYTDGKGVLALGTNLKVAYMASPYSNYEDAIVISDSASKKLTSEHIHQVKVDDSPDATFGRNAFLSSFPSTYSKTQLGAIGDDGMVKKGTVVQPGDPIILATVKKEPKGASAIYRRSSPTVLDNSVKWDGTGAGIITDVWRDRSGAKVLVKSYAPTQVADKLTNRYGGKGVVSSVVADDKMPKLADGSPVDIVLNPKGIISRMNPSQNSETLLGKIAAAKGTIYRMPGMTPKDMRKVVMDELSKNGINEYDPVYDPYTKRTHNKVLTGVEFFMKLHHTADSKGSGRSTGMYSADEQPQKGSEDLQQSKRFANMDINALISHGAVNVIKDAKLYRGQKNDEFWRLFKMGYPVPTPGQPFVYGKFVDYLKGAGINVDRKADGLNFMALTDSDIKKLSHGDLTSGDAINAKTEQPVKGGLFDVGITGGAGGKLWATIPLAAPMPSPVMEDPIRMILGMTGPAYHKLIGSQNGVEEIRNRLAQVDVGNRINTERDIFKTSRGTKRSNAAKTYGYLTALKKSGIHPKDLMWTAIPVIPPGLRPVNKLNGMYLVSDANLLYKDAFEANENLKKMATVSADTGPERLALYNAMKAVTGMGDPVSNDLQTKNVGGLLAHAMGKSSPKFSMFQRKVLTNTLDTVGRAAISPNPNLDMDQVGIPEAQAWEVYRPFIMRRLMRSYSSPAGGGLSAVDAAKMVENKGELARKALEDEIRERPVIINRAPVLHRYGMMGAWPVLVQGHALQVSPSTTEGYGADFDGDQCISTVFLLCDRKKVGIDFYKKFDKMLVLDQIKEIPMPAYFKTVIPSIGENDALFICHLSEFPRGELIGVKDHISFFKAPEGIRVVAIDEQTGLPVLAEVSGWSEHRDREIEIVTLSSGRQIVSDDDERAVYGLDKDTLTWCRRRPSEANNQFVPVVCKFAELPAGGKSIDLTTYKEDAASSKWQRDLVSSIELSPELGHLIGLVVGDGWASYSNGRGKGLCFSSAYDEVAQKFEKECGLFFSSGVVNVSHVPSDKSTQFENSKGSVKHTATASMLAPIFSDWVGDGAENKHLPYFVWSAPREFKIALLAGVWDTDGSVSYSGGKKVPQFMVNFSSNSLRLHQEIQFLLRTLGVSSTITASKTPGLKDTWVLNVSTPDFHRLGGLPMACSHKLKLQERFLASLCPTAGTSLKGRLVPMPTALALELVKIIRHKDHPAMYVNIAYGKTNGYMTKGSASVVVNFLEQNNLHCSHPLFERWKAFVLNPHINFEAVVSVEKTGIKETGWDLTVPGRETFMSIDGSILSNTMNYHVPVSDAAVKEVIEKMMPSKNLISAATFRPTYLPRHEYLHGLYLATDRQSNKPVQSFDSIEALMKAYKDGKIDARDRVVVTG